MGVNTLSLYLCFVPSVKSTIKLSFAPVTIFLNSSTITSGSQSTLFAIILSSVMLCLPDEKDVWTLPDCSWYRKKCLICNSTRDVLVSAAVSKERWQICHALLWHAHDLEVVDDEQHLLVVWVEIVYMWYFSEDTCWFEASILFTLDVWCDYPELLKRFSALLCL